MEFTINKIGRTVTFSRPGRYNLYVDLNGHPGFFGNSLCEGGRITGPAISYTGDNQEEFKNICRRWYRQYQRNKLWGLVKAWLN